MNLLTSIKIPSPDIMVKIPKKCYNYNYYNYCSIEECPEWGSVIYDFIDRKDIKVILEENIEKGKQLEIDIKLVIEGRLFSSNFERYFEKIKASIILGLELFSSRSIDKKYDYGEIQLLNEYSNMFFRLNILCESYSEEKKLWWD